MEKSKVYFTNMRTKPGLNMLDKLEKLIYTAGMNKIDFKDKFVAIKIHFGEPGNLSYIKPNYVKRLVSVIKKLGGIPFLTDSNTLYTGKRSNAVDHINTAFENGFYPLAVDCPVIIADGLKGTEYREIELNLDRCKTAKIGTAIAEADIVISLNHFKGHDMTGFGGALKNLGMGSGSRGGKLEMHSASKPKINKENCVSCKMCAKSCAQNAVIFDENKKADIEYDKCVGCGQCVAVCRFNAASVVWNEAADTANEKIAEYAYAVIKDKPSFHVNFIMNVSPNCDCWEHNDAAIIPDLGICASFNPVALDFASVNMVNEASVNCLSVLGDESFKQGEDKFTHIYQDTKWEAGISHGEKIGLGSREYDLIKL